MYHRKKIIIGIFALIGIGLIVFFLKDKKLVTNDIMIARPTGTDAIYVPDQKPSKEIFASVLVLKEPGFVTIRREERGTPGDVIGISEYYTGGEYWKISIPLSREIPSGTNLFALLHKDNGDKTFSIKDDLPVGLDRGEVIMMRFLVDDSAILPADLVQ